MRDRLASALPDLPRWVETRGMLRSGRCEIVGAPGPGPGDFLLRGTDFGLFCVAGEPDLEPLADSLDALRGPRGSLPARGSRARGRGGPSRMEARAA